MFTIGVIAQKGGAGKTITSVNLVVRAGEFGQESLLIDIDPQATGAKWNDRRETAHPTLEYPAVISAQSSRLLQTLDVARRDGAEFTVIDTPGKSGSEVIDVAELVDLILVPCRPVMDNLETLPAVSDLLTAAAARLSRINKKLPPVFVLMNGFHPSVTREAADVKRQVEDIYKFNVCPIHISQLAVYPASSNLGLSASEYEASGRHIAEVTALFDFVQQFNPKGQVHEQIKLTTVA